MKKIILWAFLMLPVLSFAQTMSDSQVLDFIAKETQAGTSRGQIVTKLIQRGVKIDQIRRLRNQYDKQLSSKGLSGAADGAVTMVAERMRGNSDGSSSQELTTGRKGTSGEVYADASNEVADVENDVLATQSVSPDAQGKRVFGRDVFNQRALTFEPNSNMPTPSTYVLGPGDQVIVEIYGASQHTLAHTISPEGTITVSGYGPISLSGLTVAAAQAKLRKTIGSRYQSSDLKVSVGNTRTIMINIMGEVKTPGTYHLSSFATVFYALYRAGGINELGTLRNVKVFRNGRLVTIVDIYEYILNGRLAGNIALQDNDVIQVDPYESLVGITGNVKRPMFYEMRKNESVATLMKYAGGFTGDANKKSVRLVRKNGERFSIFNIDEFDLSSFKLMDGDAITVDGMINRYDNMVEIKGAVFRPGQYQLGGNITTVKSLIEGAAGLTEDAFAAHAILHRLKEDRSLVVLPVNVQGILDGSLPDIPLKNEDVLFISTIEDLRQERTLTIEGEVMTPGTYQFADNTTIEDLIVQAGGLTDAASLVKVDVSRRIVDPKATASSGDMAKTYTFAIRDGLVIEGERGFLLEPYDIVQVRRSPNFHTPRRVQVGGEVTYPGFYTLEKKNQRLSDLVKMAGGVTKDAYVKGARLGREISKMEIARRNMAEKTARQGQGTGNDSVSMAKLATEDFYMVGIQLDEALKNPGCDADIVLREGDQLFIPEYEGTVKVSGDVMFANTVTYAAGENYKYYVKQAGGFGDRAKKSKSYVIYPNNTMSMLKKSTEITPGCEIIVPSKPKKEVLTTAQWLALGTGITSMATTIAMVIIYLSK